MRLNFLKNIPLIRKIYAFNLENRDTWIKEQANIVNAGSDVLDVGAGSCPYRSYFQHCNYFTQDVAQLRAEQLRDGGYGKIDYVSDAVQIPVTDDSFDVVLCTEMLEHHPEPIKVINEFARILKPGGKLLLTAPLGSGIHQEPFHYYGGYTPFWYERFLKAAGFSRIEVKPNGGFFKHYGQESIRFTQLSNPANIRLNYFLKVVWAPVWLLLFMVLGIMMPILCSAIDSFDHEKRFTVGFHVKAELASFVK